MFVGISPADAGVRSFEGPVCRYVNVEFCGERSRKGVVLLENPRSDTMASHTEILQQVSVLAT